MQKTKKIYTSIATKNLMDYRNEMRDQVRPTTLAYVLGLRISRRHTIVTISRIITPAGAAVCCPPAPPASCLASFRSSSVDPDSSFASASCPASAGKAVTTRSPGRIAETNKTPYVRNRMRRPSVLARLSMYLLQLFTCD